MSNTTTPRRASRRAEPPCSAVPNIVIAFLLGEGPLDGIWFGEKHPTERGHFWWRKHLRQNPSRQGIPNGTPKED